MTGIVKIGKNEYKTVALRVNEFLASDHHKDWSIETDLIADGTNVVIKATIKDSDGRTICCLLHHAGSRFLSQG